MKPPTITQDNESLKIATQILDQIFTEPSSIKEMDEEWIKWKEWFQKQKEKFFSDEISIQTYFTQIKRIHDYLITKNYYNKDNLFEIVIPKRQKLYDFHTLKRKKPPKLTENEIETLIDKLYKQLTEEELLQQLNPLVESLTRKQQEKRFGRKLLTDIEQEIDRINDGKILYNSKEQKYQELGELYLEIGDFSLAKENFSKLPPKMKSSSLAWLASREKNFFDFNFNFREAFKETLEPQRYGIFVLGFLIGNERNYLYTTDHKGNRKLTYVLSTGIYQINRMVVFRAFLDDIRISPDGLLGLWLQPADITNDFIWNNVEFLNFKQVLGWKDFSISNIDF